MTLTLLFWLFTKHFIVDFPLQATPWMYKNKGTLFHPGGLAHAGLHGVGTFMVLASLGISPTTVWRCTLCDMYLHYCIDWTKVNLTSTLGLTPTNSEWFWILLGLDQYAHAITYFAIASYLTGGSL